MDNRQQKNAVAYQCPSCGAPLTYEAKSGKLACAACENRYELDLLEAMAGVEETGCIEFEMPAETFGESDAAQIQAYICKGCGAELMTQDTTTATQCPYCGSPTILPERIEGGVKPEKVIPFTVTKEEAQQRFEAYFKGKKLLPNVFLNTRNRITEMQRLYVPYWLFDCGAAGNAAYEAEKTRSYIQGDYEITETEHYFVTRSGRMDFIGIPVDGSEKLDNKITESLEPYDMSAAVPFAPAVLAGAMADHADVDSEACQARARERVENSMSQALRNTVSGYTNVRKRGEHVHTEAGKATPVLMPIWLITTEKEGTTYTFAINGQTGKLTCNVPADTSKGLIWGAGVFAGVFALMCAVFYCMQMLDDMMLIVSGFVSLMAAVITLSVLFAQLKRAAHVDSAADYVVRNSFRLYGVRDAYVRTSRTCRRIERKGNGR